MFSLFPTHDATITRNHNSVAEQVCRRSQAQSPASSAHDALSKKRRTKESPPGPASGCITEWATRCSQDTTQARHESSSPHLLLLTPTNKSYSQIYNLCLWRFHAAIILSLRATDTPLHIFISSLTNRAQHLACRRSPVQSLAFPAKDSQVNQDVKDLCLKSLKAAAHLSRPK